jgi:hypothetical protein
MSGDRGIRHVEAGYRPENFRRPERLASLSDRCTDIAIELLCAGGVEQLTLNSIAKQADYTPSQFHGKVGGKAGMLDMIIGCFSERWTLQTTNPHGDWPTVCWLPHTTDGVDGVRCWHGIVELAHSEARAGRPGASRCVDEAVRTEIEFVACRLAQRLQRRATISEAIALAASAEGLRSALAAPTGVLSLGDAEQVLERLVESFGRPAGASHSASGHR